jgi:hypothetical protein
MLGLRGMFFSNTFSFALPPSFNTVYLALSAQLLTINLCQLHYPLSTYTCFVFLSYPSACSFCYLILLPIPFSIYPFRLSLSLPNLPPHIPAIVKYVFCGKASKTLLPSSGSQRVQPWNRTAYFIDLAGCLLPTPSPATTARRSFRSA